jgi:ketopantoate reductase
MTYPTFNKVRGSLKNRPICNEWSFLLLSFFNGILQILNSTNITVLKGLSSKMGLAESYNSIARALKVSAEFFHHLSYAWSSKFLRHLAGALGIEKLIAILDENVHSAI